MERDLIYLDNAATSFPKPQSVILAVRNYMAHSGGNSGRGTHPLAMAASEKVFECREALAALFGAESPEQVCFTLNTTYALNMCIKGLLKKGDHVLISDIEHNAVLRPVHKLYREGIVDYDIFPSMLCDKGRSPVRICAGIAKRLRPNTKMLICTGACNICSLRMPIYEIGRFCRRHGILFVLDAAQCAGSMKISMKDMCIDALCLPAHKGLLGPQGCGALILGEGITLDTLTEGGSGVASLERDMPEYSPERYESGTLPIPAIAGLCEGIRIVSGLGEERIEKHEKGLFRQAREELSRIEGVKIFAPQYEGSVLLFEHSGYSSEELCRRLGDVGICTRGGYHCNPLAHRALGSENGGVRVSFGAFNSSADVEALCRELSKF